jgi:7-keto-8-aminopelargonate synthetase-like enzyme
LPGAAATFKMFPKCSAAGPHTVVNGKDVINLSSANYLGLIGHPKIKVLGIGVHNIFSALEFWLLW